MLREDYKQCNQKEAVEKLENTTYEETVTMLKKYRFSLYYKVEIMIFPTFAGEFHDVRGLAHRSTPFFPSYKSKSHAKKPCHSRVSRKSEND